MSKPAQKNHWNDHARQWNRIASPLRPCYEDIEIIRHALGPACGNCLLLGVTPELAGMAKSLVAVDHNAAMIHANWPGNIPGRQVIQGDWLRLPLAAAAFDAAIGDGCLSLLSFPQQYQFLFGELRHALKPGSKVLLRLFASPENTENCADVRDAALGGKTGNFHAFKWRLAMAMCAETGDPNVGVAAIHETFECLFPDRQQLASASGWSMDDIATIDVYRGSMATYSFPALAQLRRIIPRDFREAGLSHGSYELAERCPTLMLEYAP
jgi:SAM-dependent methyltransferase